MAKKGQRVGRAGLGAFGHGPERNAIENAERDRLLERAVPDEFLRFINDEPGYRLAIPRNWERTFFGE